MLDLPSRYSGGRALKSYVLLYLARPTRARGMNSTRFDGVLRMSERFELSRLLMLPWTILREKTPEGDVILRVKEIPSAVGSGHSDADRERDLWNSLTESLRAYLHFGDTVPVPSDSPRLVRLAPSLTVTLEPMWKTQADQQTSGL